MASRGRNRLCKRGICSARWCPTDTGRFLSEAIHRAAQALIVAESGPLYAVFFLRAAKELESREKDDPPGATVDPGLSRRLPGHERPCGARKGDRTMLDAIWPAAEAFAASVRAGESRGRAWAKAVSAAKDGAQATMHLVPRRGRSSYLGQRVLGHADPGAVAVGIWLEALSGLMDE